MQKYEKGANRVSAGRLQRISDLLNVPVTFFYVGMGVKAKKKTNTLEPELCSKARAQ